MASLLVECVNANGSLRMDDNILTWQKPWVQQPLLLQIYRMPATYQDAECIESFLNMKCSKDNLKQLRGVLINYTRMLKDPAELGCQPLMLVLHQTYSMDAFVREAAMLMYRYYRKQCLEEQQLCNGEAGRRMNSQFEQDLKAVGTASKARIIMFAAMILIEQLERVKVSKDDSWPRSIIIFARGALDKTSTAYSELERAQMWTAVSHLLETLIESLISEQQ